MLDVFLRAPKRRKGCWFSSIGELRLYHAEGTGKREPTSVTPALLAGTNIQHPSRLTK